MRPALERFVGLVTSQLLRSTVGPGIRVHRGEQGVDVVVTEPEAVFRGAFAVSLATPTRARVGDGLVNGLRPTMGGVYLDGSLPPDGASLSPGGPPSLDLAGLEVAGNRSYVVLVLAPGATEPGLVAGVTVSHRAATGTDGEWPVAELSWRDGRVVRVRQMVYFDLQTAWDEAGQRWIWGPV